MQNLDDYGFEKFEENEFPIAYLITFRTFGTWLHGDDRESVGRDGRNRYGKPRIKPDAGFEAAMRSESAQSSVILSPEMRRIVELAVAELCERREYHLRAVNARSNHVHVVVSAWTKPERLTDAIKANATKMLRETGLVQDGVRIWSRGRSRRYLWKPRHVELAIHYVLYCQDGEVFEIGE